MIRLLCVGKDKEGPLKLLIDDYSKRIVCYHRFRIDEVKDEPIYLNTSSEAILNKEGERLLQNIHDDEYVILLDLQGKEYDSPAFAAAMDKWITAKGKLCFVIGGSLGLSEDVRKRADQAWKLSDLTFLHQMTRLIVTEQIYRAFKILHNENYHK